MTTFRWQLVFLPKFCYLTMRRITGTSNAGLPIRSAASDGNGTKVQNVASEILLHEEELFPFRNGSMSMISHIMQCG